MRAQPSNKLDPKIKVVWRISATINVILVALITIGITELIKLGAVHGTSLRSSVAAGYDLAIYIELGCAVAFFIAFVLIIPQIRYIRWKFEVGTDEIDILKGIIFRQRIIIPLVRVQNVDTKQGPILRATKLATVSVSTAAGSHEIPGLSIDEADQLRDKVAMLARMAQEDV